MRQRLFRSREARAKVSEARLRATYAPVYVQQWWYKKISSGVFSVLAPQWVRGTDYTGNLPWPDSVALQALYEDFCYEYGEVIQIPKISFYHYFRKQLGYEKHSVKVKRKIEDMVIKNTQLIFVEIPRI